MDINVKIVDLDRLIALWERSPAVVEQEIRGAMEKTVLVLHSTAAEEAPVGATSILGATIFHEVQQEVGSILGIVSTGPTGYYGLFVHEGTEPHYPPLAALKPWAKAVLGDERLAYPVQQKIGREGTKPNPFMQRAVDKEQARIDGFWAEALESATARIGI